MEKVETYIAFLRGVNVSGKNLIKMDDLKMQISMLNFQNVRTYIQSGNLIFESFEKHISEMENIINEKIFQHFGYTVSVLIKSKKQLAEIISNNPFYMKNQDDVSKLHITFLENEPDIQYVNSLLPQKFLPDEFLIIGKEIFLHCPNGYGKTKLTNGFFEKKFHTFATTRNFNTILTLSTL